ncbi:MAG: 16S rRNA (adenine1518-N6/adenine1519-N6)-dimethyltransferase [Parcubacteria group bacterium Athens1014_10]|nr:MAG: 16S rRNA (adenine1518-N6/adenine1519-N6)-dimethyltransferase [Parcubacteria group bacterium Athens1014_10]
MKDILKDYKDVEIIEGDILKLTYNQQLITHNFKIVANIPYSITGNFLRKFLENKIKPEEMVLLVQKEVAERIAARPGKMSLLSVAVQFYSQPEIISLVSKKSFYPEPKVDSAIIRLKIKSQESRIDEKVFFKIVKIGFSNRRKQLHNNLATGLKMNNEEIKEIFKKLNFNPKIRAQDLSVEDWIRLSEKLK